ncbi:MAG: ATP-dependent Clp protease adaptor ClpS [Planctomycetota bacterium]|nr:ATP-dependent Clp protease adaptor ClpS [Planctomycetota bacterium]
MLLHNDDAVEMEHVVRTLITVVSLRFEPAVNVMLEAHRKGVALVATTHRELAELYVERLKSAGLTATIEPA